MGRCRQAARTRVLVGNWPVPCRRVAARWGIGTDR